MINNMLHPYMSVVLLVLLKIIFLLVAIAYYTIAERKIMAAVQRRRGPNVVGFWGLLQPLADGLKLLAKEMITPSHANSKVFVISPILVLTLGLLTWSIVPFGCFDYSDHFYRKISSNLFLSFIDPYIPKYYIFESTVVTEPDGSLVIVESWSGVRIPVRDPININIKTWHKDALPLYDGEGHSTWRQVFEVLYRSSRADVGRSGICLKKENPVVDLLVLVRQVAQLQLLFLEIVWSATWMVFQPCLDSTGALYYAVFPKNNDFVSSRSGLVWDFIKTSVFSFLFLEFSYAVDFPILSPDDVAYAHKQIAVSHRAILHSYALSEKILEFDLHFSTRSVKSSVGWNPFFLIFIFWIITLFLFLVLYSKNFKRTAPFYKTISWWPLNYYLKDNEGPELEKSIKRKVLDIENTIAEATAKSLAHSADCEQLKSSVALESLKYDSNVLQFYMLLASAIILFFFIVWVFASKPKATWWNIDWASIWLGVSTLYQTEPKLFRYSIWGTLFGSRIDYVEVVRSNLARLDIKTEELERINAGIYKTLYTSNCLLIELGKLIILNNDLQTQIFFLKILNLVLFVSIWIYFFCQPALYNNLLVLWLSLVKYGLKKNYTDFSFIVQSNYISNVFYGVLFILALSSLTVYGLIVAGWSSNSKYAFLGALRSAAQMISYEVAISLIVLPVIAVSGSLNFTRIALMQSSTAWNTTTLNPISIIFFISMVAETNRTPFDLPEAEAELVAGYNVEFSSIIFAMFFLAEYGNMILMSVLKSIMFLAGWGGQTRSSVLTSLTLSLKSLIFCFLFVLIRATFPRYRYDQLMDIGWKVFLPLSTGFLVYSAGLLFAFSSAPLLNEILYGNYYEKNLYNFLLFNVDDFSSGNIYLWFS